MENNTTNNSVTEEFGSVEIPLFVQVCNPFFNLKKDSNQKIFF